VIFPPKCIVCDDLLGVEAEPVCKSCHARINWLDSKFFSPELKKAHFDSALSLASYEGAWMDVVHNFKYNKRTDLAKSLVMLLSRKVNYEYDLVVPVPLHLERLRSRGYNQSALLAKELAKLCGFKYDPALLKRTRETMDQVGLTRRERMDNVKDAFHGHALNSGLSVCPGGDMLLIDDVMTTGATVNECARALKRCGAGRVDVLTIARTL